MVEWRLKPYIKDTISVGAKTVDNALDEVLLPALKKSAIEPLRENIRRAKEIKPEDAPEMIEQLLADFEKPLTETKAFPVFSTIVMGALLLPTLSSIVSSAIMPWIEKNVSQPISEKVRQRLLDISTLITAHFRKLMDSEDIQKEFARYGFSEEKIKTILDSAKIIPSATDVISFAVREVYSPEIYKKFEQDRDLDKVFDIAKTDIRNIGMDKETFAKYWIAHWILPSITQGFEMLHRGVIKDEELDLLFTALDVMPWWREGLKKISFVPYTRVDVRRMHKLGILDRAMVKRSYLDLGYDEQKAENMTEFTIRYNAEPETSEETALDREQEEFRKLTRSDILKSYKLELITKDDASTLLGEIGYSPEGVAFYLDREDFLEEENRRDTFIKLYHTAYITGVWDKDTVEDLLNKLNLPDTYIKYLFTIWNLELEVKIKTPTKAELLGFYKREIIDESVCRTELSKLGYIDKYIDWYLQGVGKE